MALGDDEFPDPMAMVLKVKLVTDGSPRRLSMLVSGWREGKQVAGKSFRGLVSFFIGAVCVSSFFGAACGSGFCLLCLSSRSSLGTPGGRPRARLKASTPNEARH